MTDDMIPADILSLFDKTDYQPTSLEPATGPRQLNPEHFIVFDSSNRPFIPAKITFKEMGDAAIPVLRFPAQGVLIICGAISEAHTHTLIQSTIIDRINAGYNEGSADPDIGTWFDFYPLQEGDTMPAITDRHRERWDARLETMMIDKFFTIQDAQTGLNIKWSDLKNMGVEWQIRFCRLILEMRQEMDNAAGQAIKPERIRPNK